jgi:hypothetical protein
MRKKTDTVTINEIADQEHEPARPPAPVVDETGHLPTTFSPGGHGQKQPIPHNGTGILAELKTFKPSKETCTASALGGRYAHTLINSAEMSIGEALYALRQVRDDANRAGAAEDAAILTDLIERLA